jgi:hypothetical protein
MSNGLRSQVWWTHPDAPDDGPGSDGSITVLSGPEITVWSTPDPGHDARPEYALRLTPDCPVVVGRSDGGLPPYLDPAYRPTRIVPGTGQPILHSGGRGSDNYVSRGHFTLRAIRHGILFVNGVPRRGGGIRPPKNGTRMVAPAGRALYPGEEYLIEAGMALVVRLPNGTELRIDAR